MCSEPATDGVAKLIGRGETRSPMDVFESPQSAADEFIEAIQFVELHFHATMSVYKVRRHAAFHQLSLMRDFLSGRKRQHRGEQAGPWLLDRESNAIQSLPSSSEAEDVVIFNSW